MCLCHRRKYIDASNVGVVGGVIGDAAPSFNSIVGRLCLRCVSDRIRKWDLQTCPKCGGKMTPTGEHEFWT